MPRQSPASGLNPWGPRPASLGIGSLARLAFGLEQLQGSLPPSLPRVLLQSASCNKRQLLWQPPASPLWGCSWTCCPQPAGPNSSSLPQTRGIQGASRSPTAASSGQTPPLPGLVSAIPGRWAFSLHLAARVPFSRAGASAGCAKTSRDRGGQPGGNPPAVMATSWSFSCLARSPTVPGGCCEMP